MAWPGLVEVKRRAGVTVVEDPREAVFPSMPMAAIEHVKVDHITPAKNMASLLVTLANTERRYTIEEDSPVKKHLVELYCPECKGPMWELRQGDILEYRCRVGHTDSVAALKEGQQAAMEAALWEALVTLECAADTAEQSSRELGPEAQEEARQKREQANVLRDLLKDVSLGKFDQRPEPVK